MKENAALQPLKERSRKCQVQAFFRYFDSPTWKFSEHFITSSSEGEHTKSVTALNPLKRTKRIQSFCAIVDERSRKMLGFKSGKLK